MKEIWRGRCGGAEADYREAFVAAVRAGAAAWRVYDGGGVDGQRKAEGEARPSLWIVFLISCLSEGDAEYVPHHGCGLQRDAGALKRCLGALSGALERGSGALNGALRQSAGAFEEKVLSVIASRPGITRKGIIEQVSVAPRSLDRLIAAMIESGKIKRLGGKKAGGYYCKE